jgi:hypothetical protein
MVLKGGMTGEIIIRRLSVLGDTTTYKIPQPASCSITSLGNDVILALECLSNHVWIVKTLEPGIIS